MIERPERAMVVFAHPDDEIGCSGTIATWTKEGTQTLFVLCTNGDKGTEDPEMTSERLAKVREREQREAARELGVEEVVFLGYPDGELEDTREFRGELVREIRRFRPDVVLCHDPERGNRHNHRDHRICGTVTLDALFPYARDPLHFSDLTQQGLLPHKVGAALCWGSQDPDEFIDISDAMDTKIRSMLCHKSQFLERPGRDPNRPPGERIREGAKRTGEQAGVEYAEAFRKIEFRR